MKIFSKKHPIFFTVVLFFVALIAVVPVAAIGSSSGYTEISGAVGRIIVGGVLIIIFRGIMINKLNQNGKKKMGFCLFQQLFLEQYI